MKLFIYCAVGFCVFIGIATYIIAWYQLKTSTQHRIFFDLVNLDTGIRHSANITVYGDTKEEAENRLKTVIKNREGNYGLVIYETIKVEPDNNLIEV